LIHVTINMGLKKIGFCIAVLGILSGTVCGQVMEVGVNAGASGYMGDLNPRNPFEVSGLALGAFVKGNLDPYWAIGIHYNYGKIKDDDASSFDATFRKRNLNFSTQLHELSLQVDFNFLEYFSGGGVKNFTPYIFTGIGGVLFNPKAVYDGQKYALKYYETEGRSYKNYAITIPYGVGIKYRISDHLALFSQLGYRTAHTDYLDDVGNRYPVRDVFGKVDAEHLNAINLSNPSVPYEANPGGQRGNFVKRDTYFFMHIGISYTFLSDKCYAF
jgi:opacity protein-like surface antigen